MVPVIWLALIGAICSRIAPLFALNRTFFPANEKATLNIKQPIRFQGLFEATNQIAGKWKTKSIMWQILQLFSPKPSFFPSQKWMNLISHGFWKMKMRSFRLKINTQGTFPLFVYILVNFFWRFSSFSSSKPARSQDNRVHRVSKKRRKSKATTRVGCFKIFYHFKRWNTWAARSGAGVYSELIPLIRTFAPVDDFSENTNNSKDCGLQFFSNLDRYGVRCITW